jgi:hypothetical protein
MECRRRVAEIEASRNDSESAHHLLDKLYVDVLKAIAAGSGVAYSLAAEALTAEEINFDRWYA